MRIATLLGLIFAVVAVLSGFIYLMDMRTTGGDVAVMGPVFNFLPVAAVVVALVVVASAAFAGIRALVGRLG